MFLKGDTIVKTNQRGELCVSNTLIDFYVKRHVIKPSKLTDRIRREDPLNFNLNTFASRYYIYYEKLKIR